MATTDRTPCAAHARLEGGTKSEYQPWCPSCRRATAEAAETTWSRQVAPYWYDHQSQARQAANRLRRLGYEARVRGDVLDGQGPARWWWVEYRRGTL